jgi:hypothetical protein
MGGIFIQKITTVQSGMPFHQLGFALKRKKVKQGLTINLIYFKVYLTDTCLLASSKGPSINYKKSIIHKLKNAILEDS